MTAKKAPSTPAFKSTELTDATKSKVSTLNTDFIMESDNPINSTNLVNSNNTVNSTTPAKVDNLFGNEQTATDATVVTELPKQQRIGKQQRKSDFAEFKATYLVLSKRHPVNIDDSVWEKLERIARILGDRDTTVGSYINAILVEHLTVYADDIEIWRKL